MYQGTTPSITLTIAGRDLSGCTVEVYIAQAAVRIVKRDVQIAADAEGTTVACALTQEETQPINAEDAYRTGDEVHYPEAEDPIWVSTVDHNVWTPGVYGWIRKE